MSGSTVYITDTSGDTMVTLDRDAAQIQLDGSMSFGADMVESGMITTKYVHTIVTGTGEISLTLQSGASSNQTTQEVITEKKITLQPYSSYSINLGDTIQSIITGESSVVVTYTWVQGKWVQSSGGAGGGGGGGRNPSTFDTEVLRYEGDRFDLATHSTIDPIVNKRKRRMIDDTIGANESVATQGQLRNILRSQAVSLAISQNETITSDEGYSLSSATVEKKRRIEGAIVSLTDLSNHSALRNPMTAIRADMSRAVVVGKVIGGTGIIDFGEGVTYDTQPDPANRYVYVAITVNPNTGVPTEVSKFALVASTIDADTSYITSVCFDSVGSMYVSLNSRTNVTLYNINKLAPPDFYELTVPVAGAQAGFIVKYNSNMTYAFGQRTVWSSANIACAVSRILCTGTDVWAQVWSAGRSANVSSLNSVSPSNVATLDSEINHVKYDATGNYLEHETAIDFTRQGKTSRFQMILTEETNQATSLLDNMKRLPNGNMIAVGRYVSRRTQGDYVWRVINLDGTVSDKVIPLDAVCTTSSANLIPYAILYGPDGKCLSATALFHTRDKAGLGLIPQSLEITSDGTIYITSHSNIDPNQDIIPFNLDGLIASGWSGVANAGTNIMKYSRDGRFLGFANISLTSSGTFFMIENPTDSSVYCGTRINNPSTASVTDFNGDSVSLEPLTSHCVFIMRIHDDGSYMSHVLLGINTHNTQFLGIDCDASGTLYALIGVGGANIYMKNFTKNQSVSSIAEGRTISVGGSSIIRPYLAVWSDDGIFENAWLVADITANVSEAIFNTLRVKSDSFGNVFVGFVANTSTFTIRNSDGTVHRTITDPDPHGMFVIKYDKYGKVTGVANGICCNESALRFAFDVDTDGNLFVLYTYRGNSGSVVKSGTIYNLDGTASSFQWTSPITSASSRDVPMIVKYDPDGNAVNYSLITNGNDFVYALNISVRSGSLFIPFSVLTTNSPEFTHDDMTLNTSGFVGSANYYRSCILDIDVSENRPLDFTMVHGFPATLTCTRRLTSPTELTSFGTPTYIVSCPKIAWKNARLTDIAGSRIGSPMIRADDMSLWIANTQTHASSSFYNEDRVAYTSHPTRHAIAVGEFTCTPERITFVRAMLPIESHSPIHVSVLDKNRVAYTSVSDLTPVSGSHTFSASSGVSANISNIDGTGWQSSSTYDVGTGEYLGSNRLGGFTGEWIRMDVDKSRYISDIFIQPTMTSVNMVVIAKRSDSDTWVSIATVSRTFNSSNGSVPDCEKISIPSSNKNLFGSYAIVFTSAPGGVTQVGLKRLAFHEKTNSGLVDIDMSTSIRTMGTLDISKFSDNLMFTRTHQSSVSIISTEGVRSETIDPWRLGYMRIKDADTNGDMALILGRTGSRVLSLANDDSSKTVVALVQNTNYQPITNMNGTAVSNVPGLRRFLHIDASILNGLTTGTSVPSVGHARAYKAGTGTIPTLGYSNSVPHIRLGATEGSSGSNGNWYEFGEQIIPQREFTFVGYIRRWTSTVPNWSSIFDFAAPDGRITLGYDGSTGNLTFGHYNKTLSDSKVRTIAEDGSWAFIVARFDGKHLKLRRNDVASETSVDVWDPESIASPMTTENTFIGKHTSGSGHYANIDIREMLWFDAWLPDEQVSATINRLSDKWTSSGITAQRPPQGRVTALAFDEFTGTLVAQREIVSLTPTIVGMQASFVNEHIPSLMGANTIMGGIQASMITQDGPVVGRIVIPIANPDVYVSFSQVATIQGGVVTDVNVSSGGTRTIIVGYGTSFTCGNLTHTAATPSSFIANVGGSSINARLLATGDTRTWSIVETQGLIYVCGTHATNSGIPTSVVVSGTSKSIPQLGLINSMWIARILPETLEADRGESIMALDSEDRVMIASDRYGRYAIFGTSNYASGATVYNLEDGLASAFILQPGMFVLRMTTGSQIQLASVVASSGRPLVLGYDASGKLWATSSFDTDSLTISGLLGMTSATHSGQVGRETVYITRFDRDGAIDASWVSSRTDAGVAIMQGTFTGGMVLSRDVNNADNPTMGYGSDGHEISRVSNGTMIVRYAGTVLDRPLDIKPIESTPTEFKVFKTLNSGTVSYFLGWHRSSLRIRVPNADGSPSAFVLDPCPDGSVDAFLVRYDGGVCTGAANIAEGPDEDLLTAAKLDHSGDIYIAGKTTGMVDIRGLSGSEGKRLSSVNGCAWLAKISDADGTLVFAHAIARCMGSSDPDWDVVFQHRPLTDEPITSGSLSLHEDRVCFRDTDVNIVTSYSDSTFRIPSVDDTRLETGHWRGYTFDVKGSVTIDRLYGGFDGNSGDTWTLALFEVNASNVPTSILRSINLTVGLRFGTYTISPITLTPDKRYLIAQGRVTGEGIHFVKESYSSATLLIEYPWINNWYAGGNTWTYSVTGPDSGLVGATAISDPNAIIPDIGFGNVDVSFQLRLTSIDLSDWRGYVFTLSDTGTVTHLRGGYDGTGGTWHIGLFACNGSHQPTTVLRVVNASPGRFNSLTVTGLPVAANTIYLIAQGRQSGNGTHHVKNATTNTNIMSTYPIINNWHLGSNSYNYRSNGDQTSIINKSPILDSHWHPDIGFQMTVTNLYSFNSHTFTHAGMVKRIGPTLSQCRTAYGGAGWWNTSYLDMTTNGIQRWTVPQTGVYRIAAVGGKGAYGTQQAYIRGDFSLNIGEVIEILVGQNGDTNICGGGASYVVRYPYNTLESVLVVAGGSGGYSGLNTASITSSESYGLATIGYGGVIQPDPNSANPEYAQRSGAGGGFLGNGQNGTDNTIQKQGISFINGGLGGYGEYETTQGGFGGGGARGGGCGGGAGGGYTGGSINQIDSNCIGTAGGGSQNNGNNQSNTHTTSAGIVDIVLVNETHPIIRLPSSDTVAPEIAARWSGYGFTVNAPTTVDRLYGGYSGSSSASTWHLGLYELNASNVPTTRLRSVNALVGRHNEYTITPVILELGKRYAILQGRESGGGVHLTRDSVTESAMKAEYGFMNLLSPADGWHFTSTGNADYPLNKSPSAGTEMPDIGFRGKPVFDVDVGSSASAYDGNWRGYTFSVQRIATLSKLFGGYFGAGTWNLAIFETNKADVPTMLLRTVQMTVGRYNEYSIDPVTLVPGRRYLVAQGRQSGEGAHALKDPYSRGDIFTSYPFFVEWLNDGNATWNYGTEGTAISLINTSPPSVGATDRPDIGFHATISEITQIPSGVRIVMKNTSRDPPREFRSPLGTDVSSVDFGRVVNIHDDYLQIGEMSYMYMFKRSGVEDYVLVDTLRSHSIGQKSSFVGNSVHSIAGTTLTSPSTSSPYLHIDASFLTGIYTNGDTIARLGQGVSASYGTSGLPVAGGLGISELPYIIMGTETNSGVNGNSMSLGRHAFTLKDGFTFVGLLRFRRLNANTRVFDFGDGKIYLSQNSTSLTFSVMNGAGGVTKSVSVSGLVIDTWIVVSCRMDNESMYIRYGDVENTSTDVWGAELDPVVVWNDTVVNSGNGTEFASMDVRELIWLDATSSASAESDLRSYLTNKWINVVVPSPSLYPAIADVGVMDGAVVAADASCVVIGDPADESGRIVTVGSSGGYDDVLRVTDTTINASNKFGSSVAVSVNPDTGLGIAVFGSPEHSHTSTSRAGSISVFIKPANTTWTAIPSFKLFPQLLVADGVFGTSVSVTSNPMRIFVGAPGSTNIADGNVFMYELTTPSADPSVGSSWTLRQTFSDLRGSTQFGSSIVSTGTSLAVGGKDISIRNFRGITDLTPATAWLRLTDMILKSGSVAVDGDTLVVDKTIFRIMSDGSMRTLVESIDSLDGAKNFVSGDTLLSSVSDEVRVFVRNTNGSWPTKADRVYKIDAVSPTYKTSRTDGRNIIIGDSTAGNVLVYPRIADGSYSISSGTSFTNDSDIDFGRYVSVHGDTIAVASNSSVYIYITQPDATWELSASISDAKMAEVNGSQLVTSNGMNLVIYDRNSDGSWNNVPSKTLTTVPTATITGLVLTDRTLAVKASDGEVMIYRRYVGGWSDTPMTILHDTAEFDATDAVVVTDSSIYRIADRPSDTVDIRDMEITPNGSVCIVGTTSAPFVSLYDIADLPGTYNARDTISGANDGGAFVATYNTSGGLVLRQHAIRTTRIDGESLWIMSTADDSFWVLGESRSPIDLHGLSDGSLALTIEPPSWDGRVFTFLAGIGLISGSWTSATTASNVHISDAYVRRNPITFEYTAWMLCDVRHGTNITLPRLSGVSPTFAPEAGKKDIVRAKFTPTGSIESHYKSMTTTVGNMDRSIDEIVGMDHDVAGEFGRGGNAMATDGRYAVFGAPGENTAFVFERQMNPTTREIHMVFRARLRPSDPELAGTFGAAVAIDGDTIVVGDPTAYREATGQGTVYVFVKNTNWSWTETAMLTIEFGPLVSNSNLGASVAVRDDLIAVGATGSSMRRVYIYRRPPITGVWSSTSTSVGEFNVNINMFGAKLKFMDATRILASHDAVGEPLYILATNDGWVNSFNTTMLVTQSLFRPNLGIDYWTRPNGTGGTIVALGEDSPQLLTWVNIDGAWSASPVVTDVGLSSGNRPRRVAIRDNNLIVSDKTVRVFYRHTLTGVWNFIYEYAINPVPTSTNVAIGTDDSILIACGADSGGGDTIHLVQRNENDMSSINIDPTGNVEVIVATGSGTTDTFHANTESFGASSVLTTSVPGFYKTFARYVDGECRTRGPFLREMYPHRYHATSVMGTDLLMFSGQGMYMGEFITSGVNMLRVNLNDYEFTDYQLTITNDILTSVDVPGFGALARPMSVNIMSGRFRGTNLFIVGTYTSAGPLTLTNFDGTAGPTLPPAPTGRAFVAVINDAATFAWASAITSDTSPVPTSMSVVPNRDSDEVFVSVAYKNAIVAETAYLDPSDASVVMATLGGGGGYRSDILSFHRTTRVGMRCWSFSRGTSDIVADMGIDADILTISMNGVQTIYNQTGTETHELVSNCVHVVSINLRTYAFVYKHSFEGHAPTSDLRIPVVSETLGGCRVICVNTKEPSESEDPEAPVEPPVTTMYRLNPSGAILHGYEVDAATTSSSVHMALESEDRVWLAYTTTGGTFVHMLDRSGITVVSGLVVPGADGGNGVSSIEVDSLNGIHLCGSFATPVTDVRATSPVSGNVSSASITLATPGNFYLRMKPGGSDIESFHATATSGVSRTMLLPTGGRRYILTHGMDVDTTMYDAAGESIGATYSGDVLVEYSLPFDRTGLVDIVQFYLPDIAISRVVSGKHIYIPSGMKINVQTLNTWPSLSMDFTTPNSATATVRFNALAGAWHYVGEFQI